MEDRLSALEKQVQALESRLERLEARGSAAEASRARARAAELAEEARDQTEREGADGSDSIAFLTHSGRSLIVLGGAYLIRALTEGGTLPAIAGVVLGLAYAVLWMVAAGRAGSKGRRGDATFHGLTATAIAFPLVFEATLRFHFLSPAASALVLAVLAGLSLGIAWRAGHQALAWIFTLASLLTALALLTATGVVLPFGAFLVFLGLATLWLGYEREWTLLRWFVAAAADFVALGLVLRALTPARPDPPGVVVGLLLFLVGGYLASFAVRTLVRHRDVVPFEFVQTAAGLLVGLGGAVLIARATSAALEPLGAASLLLGAAAYGVAGIFLHRAEGRGVNFHFYATLALAFLGVGLRLLLPDALLALALGALAVVGTLAGARAGREAFRLHGFICILGAVAVAGLLADAAHAFLGGPATLGRASGWLGGFLLAPALACLTLLQRQPLPREGALTRVARVGHVGLLLILLGAACIDGGAVLARLGLGHPLESAGLATLRTLVLSTAAVALAAGTRRWQLGEMRWVAWGLLGATGLKILLEDLRQSPPALLFVAFAACGLAFILVPRILGASRPPDAGAAPD